MRFRIRLDASDRLFVIEEFAPYIGGDVSITGDGLPVQMVLARLEAATVVMDGRSVFLTLEVADQTAKVITATPERLISWRGGMLELRSAWT